MFSPFLSCVLSLLVFSGHSRGNLREDFFLKEVKINIFQIVSKSDKFFSNLTFHGRDRVETLCLSRLITVIYGTLALQLNLYLPDEAVACLDTFSKALSFSVLKEQ